MSRRIPQFSYVDPHDVSANVCSNAGYNVGRSIKFRS